MKTPLHVINIPKGQGNLSRNLKMDIAKEIWKKMSIKYDDLFVMRQKIRTISSHVSPHGADNVKHTLYLLAYITTALHTFNTLSLFCV